MLDEIATVGTTVLTVIVGDSDPAVLSFPAASVNVAAATEDLRVQQERYRVGAGTILDLLTSQASLTQAQTDLHHSMFDSFLN